MPRPRKPKLSLDGSMALSLRVCEAEADAMSPRPGDAGWNRVGRSRKLATADEALFLAELWLVRGGDASRLPLSLRALFLAFLAVLPSLESLSVEMFLFLGVLAGVFFGLSPKRASNSASPSSSSSSGTGAGAAGAAGVHLPVLMYE